MRNLIESSLSAHGAQMLFGDRMTKLADAQSVYLSPNDIKALAQLGERYVRETLRLLESCVTAAGQARADDVIRPVILQGEQFFLQPSPAIPDQAGLLGMMCNAFLARELIAQISERTRAMRGFPLIAAAPHPEAEVIRRIIGAELAQQLDQIVAECLDAPRLRFLGNSTYQLQNSLRATGRVGDWSVTLEDEISQCSSSLGLSLTGDL